MSNTVDWTIVKNEYVTTDISQRRLSEKHGVPYATLRDRCRTEGWVAERDEFRSNVVASVQQAISKQQADQLLEEYEIADSFIKLIRQSLDNGDYYADVEADDKVVNINKVNQAANALMKFIDIKHALKGHQTLTEKQNHEIALRRVALEEQRAQKDNDIDRTIKIVLDAGIEEYTV